MLLNQVGHGSTTKNEQNKREKETANWVLFFFLNFEIIFRFFEIIWYKTTSIISQPSIDIRASNLDFFCQSQFGLLLWRKKATERQVIICHFCSTPYQQCDVLLYRLLSYINRHGFLLNILNKRRNLPVSVPHLMFLKITGKYPSKRKCD